MPKHGKYIIDASMFEAIVRAATQQFYADAQTFACVGDKRSMAQFLHQAACAEQIYEELNGHGFVVFDEFAGLTTTGFKRIEEMAAMSKHRRKCKNCGETQYAHAQEVKCPFASTLFAPEKT